MKMSEDPRLRRLADQRKRDQELESAIASGATQTRDGKRIYRSPDGKRAGLVPRTISEKLNYTLLLQKQIDNCEFVGMYSYEAFSRSVIILLQMIPEEDQDELFKEQVKKATYRVRVPTGKYGGFGGQTYEIHEEATEYDHLKIFRAVIDLLRRRGLYETPKLWDENQTEVFWTRSGENPPVQRNDEVIEDAKE
jgi:hypothetical protein